MRDLIPGQQVRVRFGEGPKGLMVAEMVPEEGSGAEPEMDSEQD